MQKPTIGVQMMMLKDKIAQDGIRETFKKVKEIGFSTVELSQIEMTPENVEQLKSSLEEFDMKVCATSAALKPMAPGMKMETLKDDFDKEKEVREKLKMVKPGEHIYKVLVK